MRTAALLTAEDFALVAPVLGPCELIRGEIVSMSPGGIRHSRITGNAYALVDAHCRASGLGRVLTGEAGVVVSRRPDTVRGADVAFISYARLPKGTLPEGFLQQPPELVVEVLGSESSWAKMDEKVAEYHALGVDLVWVLDPHTNSVRAYPRGAQPLLLRDHDIASADPHVPGLTVEVHRFFED
jgi:Uma2 family endonuclease